LDFQKSILTAANYSMKNGPTSEIGETSQEPIFPYFEDELTFLVPVSLVSPRVLPGSEEARAMTVGSGRQLAMLLNQSSPLGAFSKILMESSAWGNSLECCHVWELLDTRFELSAFQLRRWEQDISDTGCSLLPTITVPNGGRVNPEGTSTTGKKPDGSKAQMDLRHTIKLELSPTPRTEGFDADNHRGNPDSLHAVAKLTATPSARYWKNGKASSNTVERNSRPLNEQVISSTASEVSGTLSPRFVEEYQGFQTDHTALKPLATAYAPFKPTRSSKRSRKLKTENKL